MRVSLSNNVDECLNASTCGVIWFHSPSCGQDCQIPKGGEDNGGQMYSSLFSSFHLFDMNYSQWAREAPSFTVASELLIIIRLIKAKLRRTTLVSGRLVVIPVTYKVKRIFNLP